MRTKTSFRLTGETNFAVKSSTLTSKCFGNKLWKRDFVRFTRFIRLSIRVRFCCCASRLFAINVLDFSLSLIVIISPFLQIKPAISSFLLLTKT